MGAFVSRLVYGAPSEERKEVENKELYADYGELYDQVNDSKQQPYIHNAAIVQAQVIRKLTPHSLQPGEIYTWRRVYPAVNGDYPGYYQLRYIEGVYTSFVFINKTEATMEVELLVTQGVNGFHVLNRYVCPPGYSIHEFCDNPVNSYALPFQNLLLKVLGENTDDKCEIQVRSGSIDKSTFDKRYPQLNTDTYVILSSNMKEASILSGGLVAEYVPMVDKA